MPGLPRRSRSAYRVAFAAFVLLLVAFVVLRWQPPLIGMCALGIPTIFVAYLWQTDALAGRSGRALAIAAVLGSALGVAWAFATDAIWARTYDDVLGTPMSNAETVLNLAVVPVGGAVAVLLPVFLLRLARPAEHESSDGFAIGALAALGFTAAEVLARAAPEFSNGLVVDDFPIDALWALASIRGVAAPVAAAAIGGMVGAALWFTPRPGTTRRGRLVLPLTVVLAVLAYVAENAIEFAWISYAQIVGLYAAVTVLALLALRFVLRYTARRESSRNRPAAEPSTSRLLLTLGAASALIVAVTVGLSLWLTPPPANYTCPPDCGRPPIGEPVTTNPRFTPADGSFSVSYPAASSAYEATVEPNGVALVLNAGDGGTLHLFSQPAEDRTPKQIAADLLDESFPEATIDYEIPNAQVGYHPGYGVVADVFKAGSAGDSARLRVLIIVAVKHDLALVAAGAGPFREFSPDFGSGHPSGANFFLSLDMGKYVNSFTWRGDAPR